MLTYRLGDFLLENGDITQEQLKRALEYQAQVSTDRQILLGQVLLELGIIERDTLDKAITTQLVALQEALQETNRQLESRIQLRTQDLESRLLQIRTAAEITQLAISASNQTELLKRTVELIVARFGYYYTSVFLVDESQKFAVLNEASGPSQNTQVSKGYRINAGSNSIVGWVIDNRQAYISEDVRKDDLYMQVDSLPDTQSEVALPVAVGDKIFAVLIFSTQPQTHLILKQYSFADHRKSHCYRPPKYALACEHTKRSAGNIFSLSSQSPISTDLNVSRGARCRVIYTSSIALFICNFFD
jgi:putative methionine-R-sulfoxide reductase with GAF domain